MGTLGVVNAFCGLASLCKVCVCTLALAFPVNSSMALVTPSRYNEDCIALTPALLVVASLASDFHGSCYCLDSNLLLSCKGSRGLVAIATNTLL